MAKCGRFTLFLPVIFVVLLSRGYAQAGRVSERNNRDEVQFSIRSVGTVASGSRPEITLEIRNNANAIGFRVFRISNPAEFLSGLSNRQFIHEPATGKDLAAIERVTATGSPVATWTEKLKPRDSQQYFLTQTVTVPVREAGMYLVEARSDTHFARTVIFVTNIILSAQGIKKRGVLSVVDRRTGAHLSDIEVTLIPSDAEKVTLRTNNVGFVNVPTKYWTNAVFIAQHGDDVAAIVSPPLTGSRSEDKPALIRYLYTDRPVYRPGDTVHFKVILREYFDGWLALPKESQFQVTVKEPGGAPFSTLTAQISKVGTAWGDVKIPVDAKVGDYTIEVHSRGETYSNSRTTFAVQEYKAPQIKTELQSDKQHVIQGDTIHLLLKAAYYFGHPVTSARVDYAAYTSPQSSTGDADPNDGHPAPVGRSVAQGFGALNKQGEFRFDVPTQTTSGGNTVFLIQATVRDDTGSVILAETKVLATYGAFALSATPDRFLFMKGENAVVEIRTTDYDYRPVAMPVELELIPLLPASNKPSPTAVEKFAINPAESGRTSVSVPLPNGGRFQLRASAVSASDTKLEVTWPITVLGGAPDEYRTDDSPATGTMIMDKTQYREGETARIVLVSNLPNLHYLVSVEAQGSVDFYSVNARGSTAQFRFPVEAKHSPNFFVSARAFKDGKRVLLSAGRDVDLAAHRLNIQVLSSKERFQPGEQATLKVKTTNSRGKPTPAELSLGVVDSSIYAVKPDVTPDILKTFYPRRASASWSRDSLEFVFIGGTFMMGGVAGGVMGGVPGGLPGGLVGPSRFAEPRIRKDFPPTAYWLANIQTDKRGEATVRFSVPDSLTTWRTTARGIGDDNRVGSKTNEVLSQKNILVRVSTPRFLRIGDEVTLSVIAHNYLPRTKKVRVSLDLTRLELVSGETREVEIAPGKNVQLDWRVRARVPGEAKLLAKALTDEESDALELPLPVQPIGTKLNVGYSGIISSVQSEDAAIIFFPETAFPETRSLKISTTPSIAASAMTALEYLTTYPHGCTEQIMSSFLPDVIVASSLKQLPVISDVNKEELEKKIYSGLNQLYKTQHATGGWGWWVNDADHPYMTAYVVAGLNEARAAGYRVDTSALERGSRWLADRIDSRKDSPELRAYMLYAITLTQPAINQRQALWNERQSLTPYGKSILGLALLNSSDPRAKQLVEDVVASAQVDGALAHWEVDEDSLMETVSNYGVEATATAVRFLARAHAHFPLLAKAVTWLMTHRDEGDHWGSTKQTSAVIFALAEYLKNTEELKTDSTAELFLNGKNIGTRRFTDPYGQALSNSIVINGSTLAAGKNQLTIKMSGSGITYWSAVAEYYSPQTAQAQINNHDLVISRSYFHVSEVDVSGPDLALLQSLSRGVWIANYESKPLDSPLKKGDILGVRLSVAGRHRKYMMIEDPIPAGTEIMESTEGLYSALSYKPHFDGSESHDNRMDFFLTEFEGSGDFVYFLRVLNPGKFNVNPARVEPMYEPGIVSTSSMTTVEVR
jgi:alpha-2-macroglobulin